ncbi:MAG: efflux RND transporter periplasmic adaptor subunit [Acidobacteriota bacterium]
MMKKLWISLVIFAAVPVEAGEVVTLDAQSQTRAGIVVRPVLERSFGEQTRVVGQVVRAPGSTLTVKSVLAGQVEAINVAPGDKIRSGMVLTELHSHEMLGMQGDFLKAGDRARLARSRLHAGRELYDLDGISRIELETREQEAFAALLELDQARAELINHGVGDDAVKHLEQTRVTSHRMPVAAPLDGVVLEMMVQEHQWVQAYEPLMVLGDPQRVELMLQIPPDEASAVAAGSLVEFVPVGRPQLTGRATVISRVPQVDKETRTVKVRARILDAGGVAFFPGVFIEGTVTTGEVHPAPSVPESAVIRLGAGDVVFVRTGPATFEARPVDLGLFNGSRHEVRSGVSLNEEVVVQGVFFLKSVAVTGEAE